MSEAYLLQKKVAAVFISGSWESLGFVAGLPLQMSLAGGITGAMVGVVGGGGGDEDKGAEVELPAAGGGVFGESFVFLQSSLWKMLSLSLDGGGSERTRSSSVMALL